jgi:uncharacterized membrane protein YkoI
MLDKKIIISIVIVLLIGVSAASYQITTKTPGVWQSGISQVQVPNTQESSGGSSSSSGLSSSGLVQSGSQSSSSSGSGQSGSSGTSVQVTSAQAKIIAQKNIQDASATAGTPNLVDLDGKSVYNVPIMIDNNSVGYIVVDAQTGAIIEGAGGAPNG